MNIINWFPKKKRLVFWEMDLTSLYRFIIAYARSDHGGWAEFFAWQHIAFKRRYPALGDLVASYAISVFRRRLREGKRKHGCVLKVISNCLAAPKYMFQYQLDECRISGSYHYNIQESLPICYHFPHFMERMPYKVCPALQYPQGWIIVRPAPLFGYISWDWIHENYVPYVAMLIDTPLEERRKILWKMRHKRRTTRKAQRTRACR